MDDGIVSGLHVPPLLLLSLSLSFFFVYRNQEITYRYLSCTRVYTEIIYTLLEVLLLEVKYQGGSIMSMREIV